MHSKASRLTAEHVHQLGGEPLADSQHSTDPPATPASAGFGDLAGGGVGRAAARSATRRVAPPRPAAHPLVQQRGAPAMTAQITPSHLGRQAAIYIRQSTVEQMTHNLESQRRQYGLVDRALALGWPRPQVVVIDDDLGVSGGGVARAGFERLVAEVGLGHVGIVLAIEVSRLARNNRDWYHLLDLGALVDTLIADVDGLYHPSVFNDRLLLGLKVTMSEVELHLIRSRLNGGLWEAARRGALRTHLPIGYQHDHEGRIVKVADEAIRETISLIFSKFAELGSARQVTTYLAEEGVLLPHRRVNEDSVNWRRATFGAVHGVLTNPTYAGVYGYGRSKVERRLDDAGRLLRRQVTLPLNEWAVFIPDHHDAYIGLDVFEANQQRLRSNWRRL